MVNAAELSDQYELAIYPKRGITLVRGEGSRLWDSAGRSYIDCSSGSGSINVGHCNPEVVEAICAQSRQLLSCTGIFHHQARSELFELLASLGPKSLNRVFLCNSGTEAIEAAIKFARASTRRTDFIAAVRGFHGRSMGALSATHNPKYREGFEPLVPGFKHVPFNNLEAFSNACDDKVAGVILEVVQGEGGVYVADQEYLQQVRKICSERGALLILDEIQTGFCRTGSMFAFEQYGVEPDILCLAKSIAGGVPMGAVLSNSKVCLDIGQHGTTFGGNPLACAAALATIRYMQKHDLAATASKKGKAFVEQLRALSSPKVREIRNLGLMIGLQLKEKSTPYIAKLMERGVLAIPAGPTVIRFLPPLTISAEELTEVAKLTGEVLAENFQEVANPE